MKIAFYEVNESDQSFFMEKMPAGQELLFFGESFNQLPQYDVEIISIRSKSKIGKEEIDKFNNLKLIASRTTGLDHIDAEYCKGKGIEVINVPGYGETTVAEHAFALILALCRHLCSSRIIDGNGVKDLDQYCGTDLYGKTLGVLGTGSIGRRVAKIGLGFEMRVLAYDIYENDELKKQGVDYLKLEDLLKTADIISVHLPLFPETKHLLDATKFDLMKEGAVIVNTSRGEVIDTKVLVAALESGKLLGAGLDVVENESELILGEVKDPMLEKLLNNKKAILTPHNACNSYEARVRVNQSTLDTIIKHL